MFLYGFHLAKSRYLVFFHNFKTTLFIAETILHLVKVSSIANILAPQMISSRFKLPAIFTLES